MTATGPHRTIEGIVWSRIRDELRQIGMLDVRPAVKRAAKGIRRALDGAQCQALLDMCVDLISPDQCARYLIDAADKGIIPDSLDDAIDDRRIVYRLVRTYAWICEHWRDQPGAEDLIERYRTTTVGLIADYAPQREGTAVLLQLTNWISETLPGLDRTRAVLAAETIGRVLGYDAELFRDGQRVRDRDRKRRKVVEARGHERILLGYLDPP